MRAVLILGSVALVLWAVIVLVQIVSCWYSGGVIMDGGRCWLL